MKYHARDYLGILGSHAALLLAVYAWISVGLPLPAAGALTVYLHVLLSGIFCFVCTSRWSGFAATVAMLLLLWFVPLEQILQACDFAILLAHWTLVLLVIALAAVYSFTRYDWAQKFFSALRIEIFFLLLFGVLIFPCLGIDALGILAAIFSA